MKKLLIAGGLALAIAVAGLPQAAPSDRAHLTFSKPVVLPGAMLPAGTYLFVIGTPVAGQAAIDIYTPDGTRRVSSVLAVESRLPRPAASTIDYPGTHPPALRAWFHQGNKVGFEFVYSAMEAKDLYLRTGLPVPFGNVSGVTPDRVGTITVAMTGLPRAAAPAPLGTSGTLPGTEAVGDDLSIAKRTVANHLDEAAEHEMARLLLVIEELDRIEKARSGNAPEARRVTERLRASISSMLSFQASRYSGVPALSPVTTSVLERVLIHLEDLRF